jgi:hypothetical protein
VTERATTRGAQKGKAGDDNRQQRAIGTVVAKLRPQIPYFVGHPTQRGVGGQL